MAHRFEQHTEIDPSWPAFGYFETDEPLLKQYEGRINLADVEKLIPVGYREGVTIIIGDRTMRPWKGVSVHEYDEQGKLVGFTT